MDVMAKRLLNKISMDLSTGCWEWRGATSNGYGYLTVGSRKDGTRHTEKTHKAAYRAFIGDIPAGMHVCHKCDNRKCINPDHLFIGTHLDNMRDRDAKGRNVVIIGTRHTNAKLDDNKVMEARALRKTGITYSSLANRYGVNKKTILNAINGITWGHVPTPPQTISADKSGFER